MMAPLDPTTLTSPVVRYLSVDSLEEWLARARPGDRLAYHRGCLATDANLHHSRLPNRHRLTLARVAHRLGLLADQGRVHLAQQRLGDGDYLYLAILSTTNGSIP